MSHAFTFTGTQDTLELIRILNLLGDHRPALTDHFSVGVTLFALIPASDHTNALPGLLETRSGDTSRRTSLYASLDHINRKLG